MNTCGMVSMVSIKSGKKSPSRCSALYRDFTYRCPAPSSSFKMGGAEQKA